MNISNLSNLKFFKHLIQMFLLLICFQLSAQQLVTTTIKELYGLQSLDEILDFRRVGPDSNLYKLFSSKLKFMVTEEQKQRITKGSVSLGLSSSQVPDKANSIYNAGFSGSRGTYPDKLTYTSDVLISLSEGKFQEDFSSIMINFDRYFLPNWEAFSFLDRFSNVQAGITDRYELGGGIVLEFGDKFFNHKKDSLNTFFLHKRNKLNGDNYPILTNDGIENITQLDTIDEYLTEPWINNITIAKPKDKAKLRQNFLKSMEYTYNSIIREFQKVRGALLIGILGEIENAKVSEKVSLIDTIGSQIVTIDEMPEANIYSQIFRWELRPTFDWKPTDGFGFKFRPYFKLPLIPFEKWNENYLVQDANTISTISRANYRIDTQFEFYMTGKFTPSLKYRLIFDNAPPQSIVTTKFKNKEYLITEKKLLQLITFNLKYNFE